MAAERSTTPRGPRCVAALLCLTIVGCGANPPGSAPMLPPGTEPAALQQGSAASFATELAGPDTYLPPLPTAVMVLKPDDMERNRAFCRAAMALPTTEHAEAASAVAPNLIRTRWLVQITEIQRAHAADCDFLTGTYDYARAGRLIASIRTTQGGFVGPGPFLLMIIPGGAGFRVAGINGSAYAVADMRDFVGGWGRALSEAETRVTASPPRPGLVRSVFDLIVAILGTATAGTGGLIEGVFGGL